MSAETNNFRLFRKEIGYTQEQLAERLGVSRQAVAKWESGETLPDIGICAKLAQLYGTTIDALVHHKFANDDPENGKYILGTAQVNNKGQITLPKKAREIFNINAGNNLLVLGDIGRGIAIVNLGNLPKQS